MDVQVVSKIIPSIDQRGYHANKHLPRTWLRYRNLPNLEGQALFVNDYSLHDIRDG
jgi:hypothetical protein